MNLQVNRDSPYLRVILIGADQLISAISSFLVVWLCLTSLPTETFGSFSYSWSTIALFVVLSRALFGIPALLDSDNNDPAQVLDIGSSLTGTLVLGFIAAVVTLSLYLLGGVSAFETWILGLFLLAPLILFQDQIRYLLVATKKIRFAILLDSLVLFCIAGMVIALKSSEFIGWILIFGLTLGYLLASLMYVYRVPTEFNLSNLKLFISLDFHRRSRLVSDAFLAWGFGLSAITLIRVITGDSGIAIYNGLVFLFGPVALVSVFLTLGLQAEVVRTKEDVATRHKVYLAGLIISPLLWMLMVNGLPKQLVEQLLGQSAQVILANSAVFAVSSVTYLMVEVLNLFMRTHQKFDQLVAMRLLAGITLILLILICGYLDLEINSVIWSFAVSNAVAVVGTALVLRAARTHERI